MSDNSISWYHPHSERNPIGIVFLVIGLIGLGWLILGSKGDSIYIQLTIFGIFGFLFQIGLILISGQPDAEDLNNRKWGRL